jgi:nitrite reductase/ring-hydroxylating ferredoxin subunit
MTISAATAPPAATTTLVRLGSVAELSRAKRIVVVADVVELLVLCVRRRFTVVENTCPHLGLPLDDGRVVGRTLVCAAHGFKYALSDGAHIPGWRCPAGQAGWLRLFPTRVEDGSLYAVLDRSARPERH